MEMCTGVCPVILIIYSLDVVSSYFEYRKPYTAIIPPPGASKRGSLLLG
jgi:hypothetical protein